MKVRLFPIFKLYAICLCLMMNHTYGQTEAFKIPSTSPNNEIKQQIGSTIITVSYQRPSVKGRTIFGKLVPYGKVWRTGADASTKIKFSTEVIIDNIIIPAGTYELFTIPNKNLWTIVFQNNINQWGTYAYDSKNDIARFSVTPVTLNKTVESLSINFTNVTNNQANLKISWENTSVSLPIMIDLEKTVVDKLEEMLSSEELPPYFRASMFYFENNLNLERAEELMKMALKNNPNHIGMLYRLALILEKKGDFDNAIRVSSQSLKGALDMKDELKKEYKALNKNLLKRLYKSKTNSNKNYQTRFTINAKPPIVFEAISKKVGNWWITNANTLKKKGDTLQMTYNGTHKTFLVTTYKPDSKLVWKCIDVFINVPELKDKKEWIGTEIIWKLEPTENGTQINFTHKGLSPEMECYTICEPSWDYFLKESLLAFIEKGKGMPLEDR